MDVEIGPILAVWSRTRQFAAFRLEPHHGLMDSLQPFGSQSVYSIDGLGRLNGAAQEYGTQDSAGHEQFLGRSAGAGTGYFRAWRCRYSFRKLALGTAGSSRCLPHGFNRL